MTNKLKINSAKKLLTHRLRYLKGIRVPLSPSSNALKGVQAGRANFAPVLILGLLTSFGKAHSRRFSISSALVLTLLSVAFGFSIFSHSAYAAYSASVSRTSSGTIRLAESGGSSIKPSSTGTLGTGSDTVTVTSNCTAGYNLYVSGVSGGSTNLNRSGVSTTELNDPSNYIASTTTNTGSESTLTKDTWGVGKDGKTFSKLPAYNSDTSTLTALYSGVGDASNSSKNYTVYYGANVSTAKTPGTYTGDVLYTVVMNSSCLKYTLNFNGNSATTNNLTSQELAFDSTINLADISSSSKIARTGYTLTGWKDQLGNSYGTSGTADVNPNDAATVTLTAQWQINNHNVVVNKGTNVTTASGTNSYDYNSTVTISATAFSTGYHFSGWTVNSGGVTLYSNSTMTTQSTTATPAYFKMPDNDVTVTANAAANTYTFSYNANGGSGSPATSSNTGTYGGNVTTSNTGSMSKTGYHLLGWSTSSTATSATCSTNASCSVSTLASNAGKTGPSYHNSTITLYAVWEANSFTITYSANGGTGSASKTSETAKYGTNITMPTKSTLAKSGYDFLGWSLSSTATTATWTAGKTGVAPTDIKSNVATVDGGSVTVYAVWTVHEPVNEGDKGTMQSFKCSSLGSGNYATVTDSRDSNKYIVKKLADGKCWMVQNLRLVGPRTLTSSDSNVSTNFTLPSSNSSFCTEYSSTCYGTPYVYYESSRSDYGALYNWNAVTAGAGSYSGSNLDTTTSICPKGWRLPTGGPNGEFVALDKILGGTGENRDGANTYSQFIDEYTSGNNAVFTLGGYKHGSRLEYVGYYAFYWTATGISSRTAYELLIGGSNRLYPTSGRDKDYGSLARCIASS